jgi:hypothetical protein
MTTGYHLDVLVFQRLAGSYDSRASGYRHLGTDPEPQMVLRRCTPLDNRRRLSKPREDLGDEGNCGLGEIIGVRPETEVLSLAVDSSADFRWRIQG